MHLCSICMSESSQKVTIVVFDGTARRSINCCYPCSYPAQMLYYRHDGDYLCTGMTTDKTSGDTTNIVACMRARNHIGDHVAVDRVWVNAQTCRKPTGAGPCGLLSGHPKVCFGIEAMQ